MGCDIHFAVEKKVDGAWQSVDKWKREEGEDYTNISNYGNAFYDGRNYRLFSILADVRNGVGFAGCDTGNYINPICSPKGIPEDASEEVAEWVESFGCDGHSHSHFTVKELLAYDWTQVATSRGFVSAKEYMRFKLEGKPDSWCGGIGGGNIKILPVEEMDAIVQEDQTEKELFGWRYYHALEHSTPEVEGLYTQVEWQTPYYELAIHFLSETIFRMIALGKHDEVRCVFFFDN